MAGGTFLLLGLVAAAAGVLLLRRAWKKPAHGPRQAGLVLGGWLSAAVAIVLLAVAAGFDGGPVIALCVLGAAAYALIGLGTEVRRAKTGRTPSAAADPLDPRPRPLRLARASLRFVAAAVLAASASLALAAAWSLHGAGSTVDRVVVAAYALPVVWGAAMTWSLADDRLTRPVVGLLILTAAGAALAYWPGAGA